MITQNEKRILRFLLAHFARDFSINEIAKRCGLAPNGAYEILRKLEKKEILRSKKIANLKSYKINFANRETNKLLELILIPDYSTPKIRYRYNDLKPLEKITQLCILFGSYMAGKEEPNDIDILFVFRKKDHEGYTETLEKVRRVLPFKLHDVIQTEADLMRTLRAGEKLILDILSEGAVLWGQEFLIEAIKNVAEREA